jgi:hypothetical protein
LKIFYFHRFLEFAGGITGLVILAMPAFARDSSDVQELQRVIETQQIQLEAQQRQLDAQQEKLDAQMQLLQKFQSQVDSLAEKVNKEDMSIVEEVATEIPTVASLQEKPQTKAMLSQADKYDKENPTGAIASYFDPSKTVNISGTNTSIGLHGLAQFQIIHDSDGLNNNRFDTASIPVNGAPSQTKFNVNPSQIALSSTTPALNGQFNTMISMDFNGQLDRPEPRLRVAYGEFVSNDLGVGVLAGQTYSTMFDLRAFPETLDFAGPAGLWQQRQPLLRLSKAMTDSSMAEVSLETPENVTYIEAEKLSRWPDLVVAGTFYPDSENLKHFRFAAMVRDLRAQGLDGSAASTLGWAISGSAKLGLRLLGARDNLKLTMHTGEGYGTQLKGGPSEGLFDVETSGLDTIGVFGTYGGIQHFWSQRYRSNLVYGYVSADNPELIGGDTLKNTTYIAADFIWDVSEMATAGIEYLWGERENENGEAGTSNRLLMSSKFEF